MPENQAFERSEGGRQSNIELLRILSIIGVIVLHFNSFKNKGGVYYAEKTNILVLYGLQNLFICAVNVFVLISGYFLSTSKNQTFWKPLKLVLQVVLTNIAIYMFICFVKGNAVFTLKQLVKYCLPCDYFVILYCVLYIISPYINRLLDTLDTMQLKRMFIVMLLLFSVWPTFVDVLRLVSGNELAGLNSIGVIGNSSGYTIVQFVLMYLTGAYLRKSDRQVKNRNLFFALILLVGILSGWTYLNKMLGNLSNSVAWEYCNPFVIAEAVVVFLIFKNIKLKKNRVINGLAKEVFAVYLLHRQFLEYIEIKRVVTGNVLEMFLELIGICVGIYLICWCIGCVYNCLADRIFEQLKRWVSLPQILLEKRN